MKFRINRSAFQEKFKDALHQWATDPSFNLHDFEDAEGETGEMIRYIRDVHERGDKDRPLHDEFHYDGVTVQVEIPYSALVELTTFLHEAHESFTQDAQKAMMLGAITGDMSNFTKALAKSTIMAITAMEMAAQFNDIRNEVKPGAFPQAHEPHPDDDLSAEGKILEAATNPDKTGELTEKDTPEVKESGHTFRPAEGAWFEEE